MIRLTVEVHADGDVTVYRAGKTDTKFAND